MEVSFGRQKMMFFKTFVVRRTAIRRLLNLSFNAHCFLLPILTGTLPVFDQICKRSSRFINSCLRSRNNLVRSILLCTALFIVNIIRPLVEILRFVVVVSVGSWQIFC